MKTRPWNKQCIGQKLNNPVHHRLIPKERRITVIDVTIVRSAIKDIPLCDNYVAGEGFDDNLDHTYQTSYVRDKGLEIRK